MPMKPLCEWSLPQDACPRHIVGISTMDTIYGGKPSRKKCGGLRAVRPKQARTHDAPGLSGAKGGFDSFRKDCTGPGLLGVFLSARG